MQVSGRSVHLYIESGSSFHSLIWLHRFPRIWNCLGFSYFYPDSADDRREIKRRIRKHAPPSLLLSFHPSPSPSIRLRHEKNDGLSVWGSNTLTATAHHRDSKSFSRRVRVGCPTASAFRWRLPSPESCQCREQHEVEQEKSPETAAAGVRRGDGGGAEAVVETSRSWSKGNKKVEADGERWRLQTRTRSPGGGSVSVHCRWCEKGSYLVQFNESRWMLCINTSITLAKTGKADKY